MFTELKENMMTENISKEGWITENKPNGNSGVENYNWKKKRRHGPNGRFELVQETVNVKLGQSIKIIQSEKHKGKIWGKKWREHQSYTYTNICINATLEREEKGKKKKIGRNTADNHPNLMKNITHPQSLTNSKMNKPKEIHT